MEGYYSIFASIALLIYALFALSHPKYDDSKSDSFFLAHILHNHYNIDDVRNSPIERGLRQGAS